MKTICLSREELGIMIYALALAKESVDISQHAQIDELIQTLNK
jgi:hypothetical protein